MRAAKKNQALKSWNPKALPPTPPKPQEGRTSGYSLKVKSGMGMSVVLSSAHMLKAGSFQLRSLSGGEGGVGVGL